MTSRLPAEVQRLYRLPDDPVVPGEQALRLVATDGRVRAMVVSLSRPADWSVLSTVWRGVQADLELPAPAIAVNGVDAYELWFSLAVPVPQAEALAFLQGLLQRYLPDLKPHRVGVRPSQEGENSTALVPAAQGDSGNWSAFVASDLAAVFGDEPLLDLPPGEDAQAELLGRLKCIAPSAFEAALGQLQLTAPIPAPAASSPTAVAQVPSVKARYEDPKLFLQDTMNDASVPVASRIEAAKALLGC
jgi:hypothetical protein